MTFPENFILFIDKKSFYREQTEKFWDFRRKFRNGDLLSIFEKWAESKDFDAIDKGKIWRFVKYLRALDMNKNSN